MAKSNRLSNIWDVFLVITDNGHPKPLTKRAIKRAVKAIQTAYPTLRTNIFSIERDYYPPAKFCEDCKCTDRGAFILHDSIWYKLGMHQDSVLCLGCTAKRLGRPFKSSDFPAGIPCNRELRAILKANEAIALESQQAGM